MQSSSDYASVPFPLSTPSARLSVLRTYASPTTHAQRKRASRALLERYRAHLVAEDVRRRNMQGDDCMERFKIIHARQAAELKGPTDHRRCCGIYDAESKGQGK
jgi:hypothetical protein